MYKTDLLTVTEIIENSFLIANYDSKSIYTMGTKIILCEYSYKCKIR